MPRRQNSSSASSINESELYSGRRAFRCVKARNSTCEKTKDTILRQEKLHVPHSVRRHLFAKHPEIDQELIEFMQFARSQRLPISRSLLQERNRMAATRHNVLNFKASNGYIEKFYDAILFKNLYVCMVKEVHSSLWITLYGCKRSE